MVEIADIFRQYGPQYRQSYGDQMLPSHRRAMRDIERCRTAELGGHVYTCPECQEQQYQYHSCRNRHCPKCQNGQGQEWLEEQQDLLLPAPYFLVTFTLPDELGEVVRSHQRVGYDALFRASADSLQSLAHNARFIGGQLGMVGVLHTWGRNLSYHPHVHYLVPGGGLAADGETLRSGFASASRGIGQAWRPARRNFLLPVRALSRLFRARFRDALRKLDCFTQVPAQVWKKEWVVHCQPVGDGVNALKYLAPYIFRVAISNRRILKLENDWVTFGYRATDSGTLRTCTLPALEFIRRFLQHVLPRGFVKVRYYGFLASGRRPQLTALRQHLDGLAAQDSAAVQPTPPPEVESETPARVVRCPACGRPMVRQTIIRSTARCPP